MLPRLVHLQFKIQRAKEMLNTVQYIVMAESILQQMRFWGKDAELAKVCQKQ